MRKSFLKIFPFLTAFILPLSDSGAVDIPDSIVKQSNVAHQLEKYRRIESRIKESAQVKSSPEVNTLYLKAKEEVEKNPDNAHALYLLGRAYDELNMQIEAIEAYQKSVRIKPDFIEAYVNLGVAYYKLGRYADAIEAYKKAIKIKPDSPSVYSKLGATYILCREYAMAVDTFKKVVDLDPSNPMAHFNLSIAYFLNGETNAAFIEYVNVKNLDRELAGRLMDLLY